MKKLLTCTLVLSTLSCSSMQDMISVSSVDRVDIDQKEYEKPEFYVGEFLPSKVKKGRFPASVKETAPDSSLSNRQIYFLTIYNQHQALSQLTGKVSQVNSCPSFHNLLLEHKGENRKLSKLDYKSIDFAGARADAKNISLYPILALPYSSDSDLYTKLVSENWQSQSEIVEETLSRLYENNEKEVAELCDTGVSGGYYVYENLVTYFKSDKDYYATKDGLKALLKVSALGNMIVLDNLIQSHYHLSKSNVYDSWLLSRSNAKWFEQFREHLNVKRESRVSKNI